MGEIVILTCLEASIIIERVKNNYNVSPLIREEVITELINRSDCKNGDV